MTESNEDTQARIGIFVIALVAYWPQVLSWELRLYGYLSHMQDRISHWRSVTSAGALFARQQVDIIFVYTATYAPLSLVPPALQQIHVPVIILNLQPLLHWITNALPLKNGLPIAGRIVYLRC